MEVTELNVILDRVSPVPLYHQLARQLKDAVEGGRVPKGSFLANELVLADRWKVSRPTVRRAIGELVDDGLLVRRRGVGTQVVNAQVRRPFTLSSLFDDLAAAGGEPRTEVITHERLPAPDDIAVSLAVEPDTELVYMMRLRSTGTLRLALMRNWVLVEAAGHITREQLETTGLYAMLRDRGVRPHYATQRLCAKAAGAEEARLLGIAAGAPLVTMRRVMQDDTGRPVEVGDHVYDAAHYSVEMAVIEN